MIYSESHAHLLIKTLIHALAVFVLDPDIKRYLSEHDPKALEQAEKALQGVGYLQPCSSCGVLTHEGEMCRSCQDDEAQAKRTAACPRCQGKGWVHTFSSGERPHESSDACPVCKIP